jgi:hypothetical protein
MYSSDPMRARLLQPAQKEPVALRPLGVPSGVIVRAALKGRSVPTLTYGEGRCRTWINPLHGTPGRPCCAPV